MSLPEPDNKIKNAIYDGCTWFKQNVISNYKQVLNNGVLTLINDLNTKRNLYSRYYNLENSTPIFFDRDGITFTIETFNNISDEMRNGYTHLGCWGDYLLEIYSFWNIIHG